MSSCQNDGTLPNLPQKWQTWQCPALLHLAWGLGWCVKMGVSGEAHSEIISFFLPLYLAFILLGELGLYSWYSPTKEAEFLWKPRVLHPPVCSTGHSKGITKHGNEVEKGFCKAQVICSHLFSTSTSAWGLHLPWTCSKAGAVLCILLNEWGMQSF